MRAWYWTERNARCPASVAGLTLGSLDRRKEVSEGEDH